MNENKLNENQVGWLYALRDNKYIEYYKEHYTYQLNQQYDIDYIGDVLAFCFNNQIVGKAFQYALFDKHIIKLLYKRDCFTFNEMVFIALKQYSYHITVKQMIEMSGLSDARIREIVDEVNNL